jgi:transglutaminase-like putative cysteine protease
VTASLPAEEAMELYRRISERLADPQLQKRLRRLFPERLTVPELLAWVHAKIKFNKGDIPRHQDPLEIIKSGQGKCREFSVLFTAACVANGYRARLILDLSDHVWTEVWDAHQKRWIHHDPSERRIDDPHMYERDWKKNITAVYAFENGHRANVTDTYTTHQHRDRNGR